MTGKRERILANGAFLKINRGFSVTVNDIFLAVQVVITHMLYVCSHACIHYNLSPNIRIKILHIDLSP